MHQVYFFTHLSYSQQPTVIKRCKKDCEVNIYTAREPALAAPLFKSFSQATGIKVNTLHLKDGLPERVMSESNRPQVDLLMVVDIGNLIDLVDKGVTQAVDVKNQNEFYELAHIPANLRDPNGHWFALFLRNRVLYADKTLNLKSFNYEQLADPKWQGKICIRSGQHPYNLALIAAYIAHYGEAETKKWLTDLKHNLARKAAGGDRDVARDISGKICEIGIANAYYVGKLKYFISTKSAEHVQWADAIDVIVPTFDAKKGGGTHVNISGAALAKNAPHRENAIKLLNYLASKPAQTIYANANFKYPVVPEIEVHPIYSQFKTADHIKADQLTLPNIARLRTQASKIVDEIKFV